MGQWWRSCEVPNAKVIDQIKWMVGKYRAQRSEDHQAPEDRWRSEGCSDRRNNGAQRRRHPEPDLSPSECFIIYAGVALDIEPMPQSR
jgi:hypothetical protein